MELMSAKRYFLQDIAGWLMSEKLNGVFARWDGKNLLSKNGNIFHAPDWFKQQLPENVYLEGELYIDRNMLGTIVGIVRKLIPIDAEWNLIKYCVFDAPKYNGYYVERLAYAKRILKTCKVGKEIKHKLCKSNRHLDEFYNGIISTGGEGVVLRNMVSLYELRRSDNYLKYKPTDSDEARVVDSIETWSLFSGSTAKIICRWKGKLFAIVIKLNKHCSDLKPVVGDNLTFTFRGTGNDGLPVNPNFVLVRDYE